MNTELRKISKNYFEKYFFEIQRYQACNNQRKKENELSGVRNKLSYKKIFLENLSAMRKIKVFINKPISLGLSILEISKKEMYEFFMILV